ncbi:hypothetical protein AMJ85_04820 [candidate division BRC1 bacterium SM23_51]|nr:MAG: hypothetical protein AMJ85_04820 [candidate division BRC1 bacterium SM23_51]
MTTQVENAPAPFAMLYNTPTFPDGKYAKKVAAVSFETVRDEAFMAPFLADWKFDQKLWVA